VDPNAKPIGGTTQAAPPVESAPANTPVPAPAGGNLW
jgi:hypothetical protein